MSGWCLQALGLCLGAAVTPGLLSIFVCWAMAPTQLCRSGRTLGGSMSSKISRRPWKPPGAETWDTACRSCEEGRSWGRGMVLLFLVSPPKLLEPGGGSEVSQLEGTSALPKDLLPDMGCRGQHTAPREPLASRCHPLLPWTLLTIPFT